MLTHLYAHELYISEFRLNTIRNKNLLFTSLQISNLYLIEVPGFVFAFTRVVMPYPKE